VSDSHTPGQSGSHDTGALPVGAYQFLVDRARAFVEAQGGAAPEDALIGHMFGTNRSPTVWKPLFAAVMEQAADLRRRVDGYWTFARASEPGALLIGDFVAVDVETTGLKPASNRIIEVGLIRYAGGTPLDRFSSLVHPGRKVPAYITKLTGIRESDLEDAPGFEVIAADVEAFIGNSIVVGHNVEFDLRFLNAELRRSGRSQLINDRINTLGLAVRLLPQVRRPNLDRVAKALGLSAKNAHRAMADAELAGQCAIALIEQARQQGLHTPEDIFRLGARAPKRPREDLGRARSMLDTSHLATVPRCPGVYLMRDGEDRILYIGKAKNLRDRVGSYYGQPLGYTRKMDGLIESLARIECRTTGTELEALLLEAQLIRRHQPRYNRALRGHEDYPYIKVTMSSPWPRVSLATARRDDGDRYFGPYRSRSAARRAVDLINELLPLRTCPRSFKNPRSYGSPCLQLSLQKCLGPCVSQVHRGRYFEAVRTALAFLEGNDEILLDHVHAELQRATERQNFERARQLRNAMQSLRGISGAERRLRRVEETRHKILALPSHDGESVNVLILAGARIWSSSNASRNTDTRDFARRLKRSYRRLLEAGDPAVDRTTLDDTLVVARWLEKQEGHPAIIPVGAGLTDWEAVTVRALAMTYQDFESWHDEAASSLDDVLVEEETRPPDGGEADGESAPDLSRDQERSGCHSD
jgi:DNA polymerase III subunit epsilon